MTDVFNETLHGWQNFYFMAGGAAATLLGLMFVALSMSTHLISDEVRQEIDTFTSPSIFYFVSVLLLACVMLYPMISVVVLGVLLLLGGLARADHFAWANLPINPHCRTLFRS